MIVTEDAARFVELAPADDGAEPSVADVRRRRWKAHGADVVGESDRLLHA